MPAGNIAAAVGLKYTRTGDTLVAGNDAQPVVLSGVRTPEPVFSCSIEAESSVEGKKLEDALNFLQLEDPSFVVTEDDETGQTLVSTEAVECEHGLLSRIRCMAWVNCIWKSLLSGCNPSTN